MRKSLGRSIVRFGRAVGGLRPPVGPTVFAELDCVLANGIRGVVVQAWPEARTYGVELFDNDGETIDVVMLRKNQLITDRTRS
jgi:hypothetical protein